MLNVTNVQKTALKNGDYKFNIQFVDSQNNTLNIDSESLVENSFSINRFSAAGDSLEIGSVASAEISFSVLNTDGVYDSYDFEGSTVTVTLICTGDAQNPIPLCVGVADEVVRELSTIHITLLDKMVWFDAPVSANFNYTQNILSVIDDICSDCNVVWDRTNSSLVNTTLTLAAPVSTDLTYRQILAWICQITGTCAFISPDGKLVMRWYTTTSEDADKLTTANRFSSQIDKSVITITGISVSNGSTTESFGTTDYMFVIEGNELIPETEGYVYAVAWNLRSRVIGFQFVPFSASTDNMIWLQPMDKTTFVDGAGNSYPAAITDWTFKSGDAVLISGRGISRAKKKYASNAPFTSQQAQTIANTKKTAEEASAAADDAYSAAEDAYTAAEAAQEAAEAAESAASAASTAASNAAAAASTAQGYATHLYGTCSTPADTINKVVSCPGFVLFDGATINVKFTYKNSIGSPTLNVNNTGAKDIYVYGGVLTATSPFNWVAGSTVQFVYDGSHWVMSDTSALKAIGEWAYDADLLKMNGAKIFDGTIGADQIMAAAIVAEKIAAGAVTAEKLLADVASINKLLANSATIDNGDVTILVDLDSVSQQTLVSIRTLVCTLLHTLGQIHTTNYDDLYNYDHYMYGNEKEKVDKMVTSVIRIYNYSTGAKFKCETYTVRNGEKVPTGIGSFLSPFGLVVLDEPLEDGAEEIDGSAYGTNCLVKGSFEIADESETDGSAGGAQGLSLNNGWTTHSNNSDLPVITLYGEGTWIVSVYAQFEGNSTGTRGLRVGTSDDLDTFHSIWGLSQLATSAGSTVLRWTKIVRQTLEANEDSKDYYLSLYQNSGSSLACWCGYELVKIQ